MQMKIVYLHGWLGKGFDVKADMLQQMCPHSEVIAPTLPESPKDALSIIDDIMASLDDDWNVLIVGHCIGGFYANYASIEYKRPCVLLNPISDVNDMELFLGRNTNANTREIYNFTYEDIDTLKKYDILDEYSETLVLLNSDDLIVDYFKTVKKYGENRCVVFDGGDHSFVGLVKSKPFIDNHIELSIGVD